MIRAEIVKGMSLRNRFNRDVLAKVSAVHGNKVNLACRDRYRRWTLKDCDLWTVAFAWQEA